MPYEIETKDGIVIRNIPDDVKPDSPEMRNRVDRARLEQKMNPPEPSRTPMVDRYYQPDKQWGSGSAKAAYDIGGKVTDVTGSPAAGYAANVAAEAVPALFGGAQRLTAAPGIVEALMQSGGTSLMQKALKPTYEALRKGDAQRAIRTMLEEGANATAGGVDKLRRGAEDINQKVIDAIANSTARVGTRAAADAVSPTSDIATKYRMQANPQGDLAAISDVQSGWLAHPELNNAAGFLQDIPVQLAQKLKQGTYRALESKYGEVGAASDEGQKAIARALKEGVSKAVPEVASLNAREGDLINAVEVARRRTMMQGNNNPMGLSMLAENPLAAAGFMADKSALIKSLIARALYSGRTAIPQTAGAATGAGVGAYTGTEP